MSDWAWIVGALVVVLIILVVVYIAQRRPEWGHLDYWRASLIEDPDKVYERSSGVMDRPAQLALRRSEARGSPADHARAAAIIRHNVVAQERAADGDIQESQNRITLFDRARGHLFAALDQLTDETIATAETRRAAALGGAPPRPAGDDARPPAQTPVQTPEGIIDFATTFAQDALMTLLMGDPFLDVRDDDAQLIVFAAPGARARGGVPPAVLDFVDGDLQGRAEDRRAATVAGRRAAARAAGETPAQQADVYLSLSEQNTSDSQNSHDPAVNASKRAIVERLRKDQGDLAELATLDRILDTVRQSGPAWSQDPRTKRPRPVLVSKALGAIERAKRGERSLSANASDEEVLRRVWARADDWRNTETKDKMRQAVFDALVDAWEPGIGDDNLMCVDGRISRYLGSLATLDHDPRNSDMRRLEHHKNEVFRRAREIIREAAAEAAGQEGDPGLQKAGRAYLAETSAELEAAGTPSEEDEKRFKADLDGRIDRAIDEYAEAAARATPGALPERVVRQLKEEAKAAV